MHGHEETMRAASQYLSDHPEFRPDLVVDEHPDQELKEGTA
jgi:hypothetical protein